MEAQISCSLREVASADHIEKERGLRTLADVCRRPEIRAVFDSHANWIELLVRVVQNEDNEALQVFGLTILCLLASEQPRCSLICTDSLLTHLAGIVAKSKTPVVHSVIVCLLNRMIKNPVCLNMMLNNVLLFESLIDVMSAPKDELIVEVLKFIQRFLSPTVGAFVVRNQSVFCRRGLTLLVEHLNSFAKHIPDIIIMDLDIVYTLIFSCQQSSITIKKVLIATGVIPALGVILASPEERIRDRSVIIISQLVTMPESVAYFQDLSIATTVINSIKKSELMIKEKELNIQLLSLLMRTIPAILDMPQLQGFAPSVVSMLNSKAATAIVATCEVFTCLAKKDALRLECVEAKAVGELGKAELRCMLEFSGDDSTKVNVAIGMARAALSVIVEMDNRDQPAPAPVPVPTPALESAATAAAIDAAVAALSEVAATATTTALSSPKMFSPTLYPTATTSSPGVLSQKLSVTVGSPKILSPPLKPTGLASPTLLATAATPPSSPPVLPTKSPSSPTKTPSSPPTTPTSPLPVIAKALASSPVNKVPSGSAPVVPATTHATVVRPVVPVTNRPAEMKTEKFVRNPTEAPAERSDADQTDSCVSPSAGWKRQEVPADNRRASRPVSIIGLSAAARYATFSAQGKSEQSDLVLPIKPPENLKEKRAAIILEILSSEQDYVKSLGQCVTTYISVLKRSRSDCITPEIFEVLFSNFEDVYRHERRFLHQLEEQMKQWKDDTLVGSTYKSFWEGYTTQIYSQYFNGFGTSMLTYERLLDSNSSFKSFLTSARNVSDMDLKAYLQLPLKRLRKFITLLEKLCEVTPPEHPDCENVKLAVKTGNACIDEISVLRKKDEDHKRLKALVEKLDGIPPGVNLIDTSRYVLKEGSVVDYSGFKNHTYQMILLSDTVIIASQKKDKLKIVKMAPLAEVPMPELTKVNKTISGLSIEISGTTLILAPPEEIDCKYWISSFLTAKGDRCLL